MVEKPDTFAIGSPPAPVGARSPGDFVPLLHDVLVLEVCKTRQLYMDLIHKYHQ